MMMLEKALGDWANIWKLFPKESVMDDDSFKGMVDGEDDSAVDESELSWVAKLD